MDIPVTGGRSALRRARLPVLLIALGLPALAAAGPLAIGRWSVDGGGSNFVLAGPFVLGGTIGQPDAGTLARLGYAVTGGFWMPGAGAPVAVDDGPLPGGGTAALAARILPPMPNPASRRTRIAFELPDERDVRIEVFDMRGARVRTLAAGPVPAGRHAIDWDVTDASGRPLGPGLYLLRSRLGTLERSQKLIVLH